MILENINLENVQEILEKLNKLKKEKSEYNSNLCNLNDNMKEQVSLYHKINRIIIFKEKELKEYEKELSELNEQKNIFIGNFFDEYKRKEFLKQNITRLKSEIEDLLSDRINIKETYDTMINPKVDITKNIMKTDEKINGIIEEINEIYFECKKRLLLLNKKIETRKVSAIIASSNRDIYSLELKELLREIIKLKEEKNDCDYEKIIRCVDEYVYSNQVAEELVYEPQEEKVNVFVSKYEKIKQTLLNKKVESENYVFGFMNKVEETSNMLFANVSNSILNRINTNRKRILTKEYN